VGFWKVFGQQPSHISLKGRTVCQPVKRHSVCVVINGQQALPTCGIKTGTHAAAARAELDVFQHSNLGS
jgi:hypothetical protein